VPKPFLKPALIFAASLVADANTLQVPGDFSTIQAAINASKPGDTVDVAPGVYRENLSFGGKAISVVARDGAHSTVLNAGRNVGVQMGPKGVIAGFTITNALGGFGAGLVVDGAGSVIRNNIFTVCEHSTGGWGAAIGGNGASPTIEGNVFTRCRGDDQGNAGVITFVNGSSPDIRNNLFFSNSVRAINLTLPESGYPNVVNNTFIGNPVAIYMDHRISNTQHRYRNNLLVGNTVGFEAAHRSVPFSSTWQNNLVFANGVDFVGLPDPTGANGNLKADPLLHDPAVGDFRLRESSPAIDAGVREATADTDFDGAQRNVDGNGDGNAAPDIGAFEFVAGSPRPPSSFTVSSYPGGVTVQWRFVPDVTRYQVLRGTSADGPFEPIAEPLAGITEFSDTEATRGIVFYYAVAASNRFGTGIPTAASGIRAGNRPPVAFADLLILPEDSVAEIVPLSNDEDPDGDSLSFLEVSPSTGLAFNVSPEGALVVTPANNYFGTNNVTYRVVDALGAATEGTITVAVLSVHDAPKANAGSFVATAEHSTPFRMTGSSVEGASLSFQVTRGPTNGVLGGLNAFSGDGTYVAYRGSRGADSIEFVAFDGLTNSPPATLSIQVAAPIDADRDGMPDFWERMHDINNPGDDRDGDGFTNLQEYEANTEPRNTASYLHIESLELDSENRPRLRWLGFGGLRYRVQSSESVAGPFADLVRTPTEEMVFAKPGQGTNQTFVDLHALQPKTMRYYRLRTVP
jgi:hypothetical protein